MSVAFALLLAAPMVQTLPPPTIEFQSATDFSCEFLGVDGKRFTLSGRFPEVPAGWDVNRGIPTVMVGSEALGIIGKMEVRPFTSGKEFRRFYIPASISGGEHYNIMMVLFDEETGIATIDRYSPQSANTESRMKSFATGDCKSKFASGKMENAAK